MFILIFTDPVNIIRQNGWSLTAASRVNGHITSMLWSVDFFLELRVLILCLAHRVFTVGFLLPWYSVELLSPYLCYLDLYLLRDDTSIS